MTDDNRVVSLVKSDPDALAAAVAELVRKMPGMIEYQKVVARLQRSAYLAYLEEGFTAAQALELVKGIR